MAYSDKVLDHYENPRNVGTLDKDDSSVGTGMVGAPACGDVMKLQIKVGDDGIITDAKFKKLVKSIKEFPEMLEKRPIVVDENMVVLGGNMRLKACKSAGLFEVWIDKAVGWTEQQKREFVVKDNVGFGEWDWDILANDWDSSQVEEWGLDVWQDPVEEDDLPEDTKEIDQKDFCEYCGK